MNVIKDCRDFTMAKCFLIPVIANVISDEPKTKTPSIVINRHGNIAEVTLR